MAEPIDKDDAVVKTLFELVTERPGGSEAAYAEVRRIGERINSEGGIRLMREVASRVLAIREDAQLNFFWDGIGDWQA